MLKPAKQYEKELSNALYDRVMDPDMKYYNGSFPELSIGVDDTFWNKVQMVSVNKHGYVFGYFKANFTRPENFINSLACISFDGPSMMFAKDLINFMKYLTEELEVPKIRWNVTVGNPVEEHYDKLCKKMGGRIVGTERYEVLVGNTYYHSKMYEWINDYWECTHCGHREKIEQEVMCWKCGLGEMVYHNPFER